MSACTAGNPPNASQWQIRSWWSASILATLLGTTAATAETAYVIDHLLLGVHAEPTANSAIIEVLPTGTPVEVLERHQDLAKITTEDGTVGWVEAGYLMLEKPATVTVKVLELQTARDARELDRARQLIGEFERELDSMETRLKDANQRLTESEDRGAAAQVQLSEADKRALRAEHRATQGTQRALAAEEGLAQARNQVRAADHRRSAAAERIAAAREAQATAEENASSTQQRVEALESELLAANQALESRRSEAQSDAHVDTDAGRRAPGDAAAGGTGVPSETLRELQRLAEENQRLKQDLAELEAVRMMASEAAQTTPSAEPRPDTSPPATSKPTISMQVTSSTDHYTGILRWAPWQWGLLAANLVLAFALGAFLIDWKTRRRHGGFRI